ncbi:MAG TPA: hypothetical protein VGF99_01200, partial [Myxococcota bacterium]
AKLDSAGLDRLIAIVGDKKGSFFSSGKSSDDVARELKSAPDLETRLAIAKHGLDDGEKADLKALLGDSAFASKLDPTVGNFLKALVGLEPLARIDTVSTTSTSATNKVVADPGNPEVQAAAKLKDLIKTGKLTSYYDVMIGATTNPALKAEAEALFNALPTIKPGMSGDDFVKAGLWTMAPRGTEEMQKSARYLPGRQVLVKTTVHASLPKGWTPYNGGAANAKIGTFDANGPRAITHRATLVGEDPANKNNFLIKVDGNDTPVSMSKESVYEQNQPHVVSRSDIKSATKQDVSWGHGKWAVDFASPLAKAKLCEIALKMDEHVQKLDFTKTKTEAAGGAIGAIFGRGDVAKKMVELQKSCVETVFRSIDMKYPKGAPFKDPGRVTDGERDVAKQAIRGTGMCVQQSAVFGALLQPFADVLGVDSQYKGGDCFRNITSAVDNVFGGHGASGHGWWQLTFRPSMEMTVTDRTWNQVNLPLDRAYGFPYGDRNPTRDIYGYSRKPVASTDVDVSGNVNVATFDRQFAKVGDGRENHISKTQG